MFSDFLAILFPKCCLTCDTILVKGEDLICSSCLFHLPSFQTDLHNDKRLDQKFYGKVPIENVWSYLEYKHQNNVQKLIYHFKYYNQPKVGGKLIIPFAFKLKDKIRDIDCLIPIPLHPKKLKKRGYNQSELLTSALSNYWSMTVYENVLLKTKNTSSQTFKNVLERWQNQQNIYELVNEELIKDKHILLVDDVLTTGATLETCANLLLEKGASKISVLTLSAKV